MLRTSRKRKAAEETTISQDNLRCKCIDNGYSLRSRVDGDPAALHIPQEKLDGQTGTQQQSHYSMAGQAARPGTKLTLKFKLHGLVQTAQMSNSPSEGPLLRDTTTLQSSAEAPVEQTAVCQIRTDEALSCVAGKCHAGES